MTLTPPSICCCRGSSLLEAVIAIGVLAVAIPLVFGTLVESGKSGLASQAETRSTWIVSACVDEIGAASEGRSQYFAPIVTGQAFPPDGQVWALAFSADGTPLGRLSETLYDSGASELDGKPIRYIAEIRGSAPVVTSGSAPLRRIDVSLEYPAAQKVGKRAKLEFHTRIP